MLYVSAELKPHLENPLYLHMFGQPHRTVMRNVMNSNCVKRLFLTRRSHSWFASKQIAAGAQTSRQNSMGGLLLNLAHELHEEFEPLLELTQ
jgi:hypothetical protein